MRLLRISTLPERQIFDRTLPDTVTVYAQDGKSSENVPQYRLEKCRISTTLFPLQQVTVDKHVG